MVYNKTKWFFYTVAVGLIPFITRLIVFIFLKDRNLDLLLNEMDFVTFGLIMHISNINELEHFSSHDKSWKTRHIGISILFIVIYGVIFGTSCVSVIVPDLFDRDMMVLSSLILGVTSFLIGYSLYDRMSKLRSVNDETVE